jgi:hypothetical protein
MRILDQDALDSGRMTSVSLETASVVASYHTQTCKVTFKLTLAGVVLTCRFIDRTRRLSRSKQTHLGLTKST